MENITATALSYMNKIQITAMKWASIMLNLPKILFILAFGYSAKFGNKNSGAILPRKIHMSKITTKNRFISLYKSCRSQINLCYLTNIYIIGCQCLFTTEVKVVGPQRKWKQVKVHLQLRPNSTTPLFTQTSQFLIFNVQHECDNRFDLWQPTVTWPCRSGQGQRHKRNARPEGDGITR